MKRKIIRRSIFLIAVLVLIVYTFNSTDYFFTEHKAIRNSLPYIDGQVVYAKDFENKKTIIWKSDNSYYLKLVKHKVGIFYHVSQVAELRPMSPLIGEIGDFERTWSASLNSDNIYETIFAIKANNPDIKKVIISNDDIDDTISENLNEIKENSTIYIELNLTDGIAAYYKELNSNEVRGFIFRGMSDNGEIIVLGR